MDDPVLREGLRRILTNLAISFGHPASSRDAYIAVRRAVKGVIALYDAKYGVKSDPE